MEVLIPTRFECLLDAPGIFTVVNAWEVTSVDDGALESCIRSQLDVYIDEFGLVLEQSNITDLYCLISGIEDMSLENRAYLADCVIELADKAVDTITDKLKSHGKNNVKILVYYLQVMAAKYEQLEKADEGLSANGASGKSKSKKVAKKASDEFCWADVRPHCLELFLRVLTVDQSYLWQMGIVQENFLNGLWTLPMQILEERPLGTYGVGHKEVSVRSRCMNIIAVCTTRFGSTGRATITTALVDAITRNEHIDKIATEICRKAHVSLSAEVMQEIARMNMNELSKSGAGVKNVGSFIVTFAEHHPAAMFTCLPIIINQLDADVWTIRSCILQSIGHVVAHIHASCDPTALKAKGFHLNSADLDQNKDDVSDSVEPKGGDDENSDDLNTAQYVRAREGMLNMLVERTHDVNAFVRAAVMKIWVSLLESNAIPVMRISSLAEIAVDRLFDKTAAVRKGAVTLMTALLEFNPFSGSLNSGPYQTRVVALKQSISDRIFDMRKIAKESAVASGQVDEDGEENDDDDEIVEDDDDDFANSDEVTQDNEIMALRAELEYCTAALNFLTVVESGVPKVEQMIASKTTSDVVEALRFFTSAVNFSVQGSAKSLRSTFSLIWHREENIRNECLASFRMAFLTDGAGVDAQALVPDDVAANIVALCKRCGTSELTSLEKIIGEIFSKSMIEPGVINSLWTMATNCMTSDDSNTTTLGSVLLVIAMISKFQPAILTPSKLQFIIQSGLGSKVSEKGDFLAMRSAAQCLQNLPAYLNNKGSSASSALKAVMLEAVPFLVSSIHGKYTHNSEDSIRVWFSVCEECMHALFHVHPSPDKVLPALVAQMYANVSGTVSGGSVDARKCSPQILSKLLFLLGQAAVCSLVFTERIADIAKKMPTQSKTTTTATEKDSADAMEEEMGMVAAADADHERIYNHVTETQLVVENLLGKFHQLIAFIVANQSGHFSHSIVRETSVLALCRYMGVSCSMCELYLPLLFTVLETEKSDDVRTTIVIALGDLAFRFPNSLEPWTAKFYARLSDNHVAVRYNTLMTLTHLVLNDMIKVKGQVSHIVLCLVDPCAKVRGLANLFFNELSKRSNNPVYNLLGDIIGALSRGDNDSSSHVSSIMDTADATSKPIRTLSAHEFQSTMQFLLGFVKKDKQGDSLAERLLTRMGLAQNSMQIRNLAYCISQLPITEKGVKKMSEMLPVYKDCLHDDEVYEYFKQALVKTKKSSHFGRGAASNSDAPDENTPRDDSTPDENSATTKSAIEEFELRMERVRGAAEGEEIDLDHVTVSTSSSLLASSMKAKSKTAQKTAKKAAAKTTKKVTVQKKKKVVEDWDGDSDEDNAVDDNVDDDDFARLAAVKKTTSRRKPLTEVN